MTPNEYKPRTTCPPAGNPYYTTIGAGGYSPCMVGSPKTAGVPDCLPNCVGYAVGRFNEIGGYKKIKYLGSAYPPDMLKIAEKQGLTISSTPVLGGMMIWQTVAKPQKGHAAIVEAINADGSILTSDSAYNGKPFYTSKRSAPNWYGNNDKRFLGCIVNPAVSVKMYRVQVGAFYNRDFAYDYMMQLRKQGIDCFIVEV